MFDIRESIEKYEDTVAVCQIVFMKVTTYISNYAQTFILLLCKVSLHLIKMVLLLPDCTSSMFCHHRSRLRVDYVKNVQFNKLPHLNFTQVSCVFTTVFLNDSIRLCSLLAHH